MTSNQILDRVNKETSARFPEVIERAFLTLRNRHTHNSWRGECDCDYCRFITDTYTRAKINHHVTKNKLRYLGWDGTEEEIHRLEKLIISEFSQRLHVQELKRRKNELKEEIV